jgi:hypothetical protein
MAMSNLHYLDVVDGEFRGTTAADLEAVFAAIKKSESNHIVVHFHGGLVSHSAADTMAEGLLPHYLNGRAYPLFFFWNSSVLKVLANNLDEVAKEPVFWRLVRRLAQLLAGQLADVGVSRGLQIETESLKDIPDDPQGLADWARKREPANEAATKEMTPSQQAQIERELKQDAVLRAESRAIAAGLRNPNEIEQDLQMRARGDPPVRASRKTLMSPAVLKRIAEETPEPGTRSIAVVTVIARYGVQIAMAVVSRYRSSRHHGLLATIAEEVARTLYADSIGSTVWALMKGDTRDAFGPDPLRHAGTAFIAQLAKWWRPGQRITLVGHSTGAIYIGYLLEHADAKLPPEVKFDVVFLAPACTFGFLHERLPLLSRRVTNFRMFALSDELESGYWEVPVLYPSSLLYMVSGLFEDPEVDMPIVGMQRYFSGKVPYDLPQIRSVAEWMGERSVWSVANGRLGQQTGARKHGGFHEDPVTRASLTHILQNGF